MLRDAALNPARALHHRQAAFKADMCMARAAATFNIPRMAQTLTISPDRLKERAYPTRGKACVSRARMAELVDAPASGAGAGNGVEVRVLFRAPFLPHVAFLFATFAFRTIECPQAKWNLFA